MYFSGSLDEAQSFIQGQHRLVRAAVDGNNAVKSVFPSVLYRSKFEPGRYVSPPVRSTDARYVLQKLARQARSALQHAQPHIAAVVPCDKDGVSELRRPLDPRAELVEPRRGFRIIVRLVGRDVDPEVI